MKSKIILALLLFGIVVKTHSQEISVIPYPSKVQVSMEEFVLNKDCDFNFDGNNPEIVQIAAFFNDFLKRNYDFQINESGKKGMVQFKLDRLPGMGNEGYRLEVTQKGITILANAPAGIFYGFQTLKQLLPLESETGNVSLQTVEIEDQPRFPWRGSLLDVARHFFPVSFIKSYIDILATYKINVLQLHLTDDQGWRIEIKKYPKLTEMASWRVETLIGNLRTSKEYDGRGYGGFYTKDQLREIVDYAARRYINVIPEFEMPGHASAALTAYPHIGCTGGPYRVETKWGVFKDIFCAGNEETFTFIQDILDEILQIFPSEFIHVGGDEAPKDRWKACAQCQARMQQEGLKDENELQSYFISRIDKFLTSKNRRLIGWDEILDGGLAPGATVMSWRGIEGGIKAAKMRHDVVMSPTTHLYFDYSQSENKDKEPLGIGGFIPLEKVYLYEPIPENLTSEESKHILGAQANLWTEYIASGKHVEYMLLPRLLALSEVVWSPKKEKDFTEFEKRVIKDYNRMKNEGLNFRDHRR